LAVASQARFDKTDRNRYLPTVLSVSRIWHDLIDFVGRRGWTRSSYHLLKVKWMARDALQVEPCWKIIHNIDRGELSSSYQIGREALTNWSGWGDLNARSPAPKTESGAADIPPFSALSVSNR
jgi:hypothetical protein